MKRLWIWKWVCSLSWRTRRWGLIKCIHLWKFQILKNNTQYHCHEGYDKECIQASELPINTLLAKIFKKVEANVSKEQELVIKQC